MEYIKKNKIMLFAATWMQIESIILSEVSQKEKDKYHMISLICGILKNNTDQLIYKTGTDLKAENKLRVNKGKRGGGGIN